MIAEFSPWEGLLGGMLIGLSATLLMALKGRIAGISGIVSGAIEGGTERSWQLPFVIALALSWVIYQSLVGPITMEIESNVVLLAVAGLLVGVGTRMGNGCTSGHGVCGMSRGSVRSITATCVFMAVAGITVYIKRHVLGGAL